VPFYVNNSDKSSPKHDKIPPCVSYRAGLLCLSPNLHTMRPDAESIAHGYSKADGTDKKQPCFCKEQARLS
jgi:hypothetical protein